MAGTGKATRHEGSRTAMQSIVANLGASGISKDLFVQFLGDGCLLDKVRNKPDLVWSTLHNSIKNSGLFLNWLFLDICEDSRSTADYFPIQPLQSLCSQCTPTNSRLFFIFCPSFRHDLRLTTSCFIKSRLSYW